ncbi:MAG: 50S ribosomal protein L11 methyltransferase [Myxococcota bacterium]|nr:50S ribosomal protein L11 methyltransferase [Myxococcota bacterium]
MSPARPQTFCLEVEAPDLQTAERIVAEAWAAGASGVEEREGSAGRTLLLLYVCADGVESVQEAIADFPSAAGVAAVEVVPTDWSQAWRRGLEAVHVGECLVVRPSWISPNLGPQQVEIVVDPGQAFGTGGHVSTRLALEWIEAVSREESAFCGTTRVLDVGAGTGVLALAAVRLGVGRAIGFDLDPLAGASARETAGRNGLADRFAGFVGPISAVAGATFDWVFANLLKRELLPLAADLASATRPGGRAIFSGLLATEHEEVESVLTSVGFGSTRVRRAADPNGDEWVSLLMMRA